MESRRPGEAPALAFSARRHGIEKLSKSGQLDLPGRVRAVALGLMPSGPLSHGGCVTHPAPVLKSSAAPPTIAVLPSADSATGPPISRCRSRSDSSGRHSSAPFACGLVQTPVRRRGIIQRDTDLVVCFRRDCEHVVPVYRREAGAVTAYDRLDSVPDNGLDHEKQGAGPYHH
jgi:hypothetical protein